MTRPSDAPPISDGRPALEPRGGAGRRREIDTAAEKFFTNWDSDNQTFTLQVPGSASPPARPLSTPPPPIDASLFHRLIPF